MDSYNKVSTKKEVEWTPLGTLTAMEDLIDYFYCVMGTKGLPNSIRYSACELILENLYKCGGWIHRANLSLNINQKLTKNGNKPRYSDFDIKKRVAEAHELYTETQWQMRMLVKRPELKCRKSRLAELEVIVGKRLGGWLNYVSSRGTR
jgi:hypothetical protein